MARERDSFARQGLMGYLGAELAAVAPGPGRHPPPVPLQGDGLEAVGSVIRTPAARWFAARSVLTATSP